MLMRMDKGDKSLFIQTEKANLASAEPLAARMRPRNLDEFIGQRHFLGPDKLLTRILEADKLSSLIFYGPPGTGKTSLAMVIANYTKAVFHYLSAPAATVKDIREVIAAARDRLAAERKRTDLRLVKPTADCPATARRISRSPAYSQYRHRTNPQ
jgi:putative ATPase